MPTKQLITYEVSCASGGVVTVAPEKAGVMLMIRDSAAAEVELTREDAEELVKALRKLLKAP